MIRLRKNKGLKWQNIIVFTNSKNGLQITNSKIMVDIAKLKQREEERKKKTILKYDFDNILNNTNMTREEERKKFYEKVKQSIKNQIDDSLTFTLKSGEVVSQKEYSLKYLDVVYEQVKDIEDDEKFSWQMNSWMFLGF